MVTIRHAVLEDEEAVFRLASQLSAKFVVERPAFSAAFPVLANASDVYLGVAEVHGEVIGYLLGWSRLAFYSNGPVGWVQEIVVHPGHRRSGAGKMLMDRFELWSAELGGRLVSLATRGATDFYLALGYQESATYFKKPIVPKKA